MTKRKSRTSSPEEKQNSSNDDSDGTAAEPPSKKRTKQPKTSAEWCEENGIEDVNLEYTEADYTNLTSFSLYSRMIRPQIAAVNARLPSSKMTALLEAKWREFQELSEQWKETAVEQEEEEEQEDEDVEVEDGEDENDEDVEEEEEEEEEDGDNDKEGEVSTGDDKVEEEEEEEEDAPSARPRLSLKVRLPIFAQRRSTREKKPVVKDDFSDGDSEEEMQEKRRKKKQKNADLESEEEIYDTESDYEDRPKRRKREQRKNKRKKTKYVAESASNEEDSAEDAADSDDDKWASSKRSSHKPVIPGERKSERTRFKKSKQMTDREFEKMMKTDDSEKKKRRERAQQKKKKAKKAAAARKKIADGDEPAREDQKKIWQVMDGDGDGNDSDHSFYCVICKDGGQLLLCDTCPKSYHKECLKIEEVPDGEWSCPICVGESLPEAEEEEEDAEDHDHVCRVCKDGGEMLLCDFCPFVYHMHCLNPPITVVPEGDWKCPFCVVKETPLKGQVQKVLTWRWTLQEGTDELDHTHSPRKKSELQQKAENEEPQKKPEREILVKYKYHSYWDCEWISELAFEVHQTALYRFFKVKWDQDEPPALEDGGSNQQMKHRTKMVAGDLQERFYKYGIKPEWLLIHRILVHEGGKKNCRYLVKWKGLSYEEATWEVESDIPEEARKDWNQHEKMYWSRRNKFKEKLRKENGEYNKNKKLLLQKLAKQPSKLCQAGGGTLHPYQLEGLNWLRFSWAQNTNTILADEMGLGKTIQTIAFIACLYNEGYSPGPFLISAPLSTVPNWERELEFWAPELYVVTYTGGKLNRAVIRERDFCYRENAFAFYAKAAKLRDGFKPKFDVLLTSYEMASQDQVTLQSIDWAVLIIDEAHRLKNNESLYFRTLSQYKIAYKLLLTGTPLQNTLEELFNLLNFLEPKTFEDMNSFLSEFTEATKDEQVSRLHAMLAPHMLRRLKSDVLKEIPSKTELIVRVELSDLQKKFYKHILTRNYDALNVRGHSNQTSLLNIMMDLRKCCNHPYLFPSAEKDAPLTRQGLYEGSGLIRTCGKLDLLAKMLRALKAGGHRVLIFSQMTRMLDILEDFMVYMEFKYERLDGSTMGDKRQESIDRFNAANAEQFAFLLSTKAGGLGLNLATADTVIIYDMDWNPHNDIQAFSRAHRIGQQNKVLIYRFVSKDTVEEKIIQVCKQKMMLTELIIHKGLGSSEKKDSLTKQEVNDILKFGAEQLFKDDEEGKVVYDDAAIQKLVNRDQEGEEQNREFGLNEYLRSFKVASYKVKETQLSDEEDNAKAKEDEQKSASTATGATEEDDASYWERVLGVSYSVHMDELKRVQAEIAKGLGKGKRIRKQINYAESQMLEAAAVVTDKKKDEVEEPEEDVETKYLSDYEPDSTDSEFSGAEDEAAQAEGKENATGEQQQEQPKKKKKKHSSVVLPPLLTKVNGQIQVLGLSLRQRRVFLDTVMRFGLPPENAYRSQWAVRELRSLPEKVFKAYGSLFLRHLCEPITESADKFADGVPREGLSHQHVLTRIGMIALIRRKVEEFEEVNGTDSMKEFLDHIPPGPLTAHTEEQRAAFARNRAKVAMQRRPEESKDAEAGRTAENKDSKESGDKVRKGDDGDEKNKEESIMSKDKDVEVESVVEKKDSEQNENGAQCSEGNGVQKNKEEGVTEKMEEKDESGGKTQNGVEKDGRNKNEEKKEEAKEEEDGDDKKVAGTEENDKLTTVQNEGSDKIAECVVQESTRKDSDANERGEVAMETDSTGKDTEKNVGSDDMLETDISAKDKDLEQKTVEAMEVDLSKDGEIEDKIESPSVIANNSSEAKGDSSEVTAVDSSEGKVHSSKVIASDVLESISDLSKVSYIDSSEGKSDSSKVIDIDNSEDKADSSKVTASDSLKGKADSTMVTDSLEGKDDSKVTASDSLESKDDSSKVTDSSESKDDSLKVTDSSESKDDSSKVTDSSESKDDSSKVTDSSESKDDSSKVADSLQSKDNSSKVTDSSESKDDSSKITDSSESKDDSSKVTDSSKSKDDSSKVTDSSKSKDDSSKVTDSSKVITIDLSDQKEDVAASDGSKEKMKVNEQAKTTEQSTNKVTEPVSLAELMSQLRKRFWIADGGLTDIHRVWMIEEQMMARNCEFLTWHRRHDYWLLAGVVAHGYRNWQDILADPNFDILNRAFTTPTELMKMAAFLNRRFQLLQQAIVIEEQLCKAVRENESGADEITSQDRLRAVDKLAGNMRRVGQGQAPLGSMSEKKLHVVLNNVTNLANDMRLPTGSQSFPVSLYPTRPPVPVKQPPVSKKTVMVTATKPVPTGVNNSVILLD